MEDHHRMRFWVKETKGYLHFPNKDLVVPSSYFENTIPESCTGLKDKNGKLIYEGDIANAHYFFFDGRGESDGYIKNGKIFMQDGSWCIGNKKLGMRLDQTTHFEEPCVEIIGNIHENPELLK
jgi:uncharacterized phage protein (TIGR01671 family)